MAQTRLTADQKQQFFTDGFIVIRGAVSDEAAGRAADLVTGSLPDGKRRLLVPPELATAEPILDLFNQSCLAELLANEMGPFPDVISSQVAVTPAYDSIGGTPGPHVDGSWSGPLPSDPDSIDPISGRPHDATTYFGENDDRRGGNDGQLWLDPDRRISLGCYTALVGVALNDQLIPGNGQLGVMRGMHRLVEQNFRRQRDTGSIIGPEGSGWPRLKTDEDGRVFLNGLFDEVRAAGQEAAADTDPTEGWPWKELTPVLLARGDAVIALHACPHTPTPNNGPNPRMNVYFRIRRLREQNPHEGSRRLGHGVSDHLDRGYYGQFLEYPDDYDPWATSIAKMCDHWSEWDGMAQLAGNRFASSH